MSSFFDEASLVMIPSGYKNQKVYSVKPLDGSGDLTFSRASNATRVASDGLIEKVRTNLALYSEQFDNAAWTPTGCTITANTSTDPLGGTTADKMVSIASNTASKRVEQIFSAVSGTTYTVSAYFKADGWNFAFFNAPEAQFTTRDDLFLNLANGTLSGSTSLGSVENVGNGWYRLSYTRTATASGSTSFRFGFSDTAAITSTGDGTSGVLIWGAQLEVSDFGATDYIATTTTAVSVGPVSGLPRLDYLNSTCPRLLLEPQRTNIALFSEQFDNGVWTKSATTISANSAISPSGYQDADEATISVSGGNLRQVISVSSSTAYTFSFYVKRGTATNLKYNVRDFTNGVDITAIVDYTSQTSTTEWSRIVVSFTTPATCTSIGIYPHRDSASTGTFYIWGAQLEAGSYATSYIPTLSTSVTRLADAASKTGISSLIGQTEGTLFIDIDPQDISGSGRYISIEAAAGIGSGWIGIFASGGTPNLIRFYGDGFDFSAGLAPRGVRTKAAFAYKNGVLTSAYVNGASVGTLTANTTGKSYDKLVLSSAAIGNAGCDNNYQTLIFKTALTNAQLAELTTL